MEQAAALTMSDKTPAPTREATPAPTTADAEATAPTPSDTAAAPATASTAADVPTSPTLAQRASQHGLYSGNFEEEVGQVMRGLGSFWGGFKAKSASTLTSLKVDLDKTVAQVQSDLKHLQETKVEVVRKEPEEWEREQEAEKEKARIRAEEDKAQREAETTTKDKGKGKAREGEGESEGDGASAADPSSATGAQAILSRLSSSTNQLQSTLQSTLASTLAAAKANPALSNPTQLREQLAENLRLSSARENLTLSLHQAEKLAEDYLKKGEGFLKQAERVGGNLVKDAEKWVEENVRVIPPGDATFVPSSGWDAGEWYSFSTSAPAAASAGSAGPGSSSADATGGVTPRASLSSAAVAGSRKEALLRRLREDKELLLVDPASEAESKERRDEFAAWVEAKWPTAKTVGREAEEANVGAIRMEVVPEHLSDEQFWQRYLFHKDMIEAADAKRKLLLQVTQDQDQADDFSWDDDDEAPAEAAAEASAAPSGASTTPTLATGPKVADAAPKEAEETKETKKTKEAAAESAPAPVVAAATTPAPVPAAKLSSPATSPRDSEESYDVVSGQVSTAAATEEDSDSDWE